ncbi:hypothetical protein HELRODRAFT_86479, partial [Helobdella robusta]|uniref:Dynein heavy chain tail domain-containing protein n=1 Tax=Helobdella robusta TaxID=6412 RepID=T1G6C9_HELRO
PVVGKISWARVLSKKLENPIHHFMAYSNVMNEKMAHKIVYNYNIMQQVLVEFELVYHDAWVKSIESLHNALQVSPLAKDEDSEKMHINLDPVVLQVFEEANSMIKLNLPVPYKAKLLLFSEHEVKRHKYLLQVILNRSKSIRKKPPEAFNDLFVTSFNRVTYTLGYGVRSLTWTSAGLSGYCKWMINELDDLELFIDKIVILKERRIDNVLDNIATSLLFDIDIVQANSYFLKMF